MNAEFPLRLPVLTPDGMSHGAAEAISMLVIGRKGPQKDPRPLTERLRHLLALLRAEHGGISLGGWAQEVLQDARHTVATASLRDPAGGTLTLHAFEGLGLCRELEKDGVAASLGYAGPVDSNVAAKDVETILQLLDSANRVGGPGHSSQAGQRRRGRVDEELEDLRRLVRRIHDEIAKEGLRKNIHKEICARLHNHSRPPGVNWEKYAWDVALLITA